MLLGIIEGALELLSVKSKCVVKGRSNSSQLEEDKGQVAIEINYITKRHLNNLAVFNGK